VNFVHAYSIVQLIFLLHGLLHVYNMC